MCWDDVSSNIEIYDSQNWGTKRVTALSATDRSLVLGALFSLYNSSPTAASWMDALTATGTLKIGQSADTGHSSFAPDGQNVLGVNIALVETHDNFTPDAFGPRCHPCLRNVLLPKSPVCTKTGWRCCQSNAKRSPFLAHLAWGRGSRISYKRHRFPSLVIQHAVWLYFRFTLSFRDVEEMLAQRGIKTARIQHRSGRRRLEMPTN